jgi:hypothetical protein
MQLVIEWMMQNGSTTKRYTPRHWQCAKNDSIKFYHPMNSVFGMVTQKTSTHIHLAKYSLGDSL